MLNRMLLGAIVFLFSTGAAGQPRPCPPDIDCSGSVNVNDLLLVINHWGQSGVPADVDGDGLVNVNDLLLVINAWGPCVQNFGPVYPNAEAHQIGLEMLGANGPLVLDQARYDRIVRDVALIRAARPELGDQYHSMAWVPNQLLVSVPNPQAAMYLCMNTYYRVTNIQPLFSTWYVLTFAGKVNVPALAQKYQQSGSVTYAEPNGIIGGQNFWVPTDQGGGVWRWDIDDGWHDCTDGCDCHRFYVIFIDEPGNVTVQSVTEWGAPWCVFDGGGGSGR